MGMIFINCLLVALFEFYYCAIKFSGYCNYRNYIRETYLNIIGIEIFYSSSSTEGFEGKGKSVPIITGRFIFLNET